jgi:Cyclin, N-terminal domain
MEYGHNRHDDDTTEHSKDMLQVMLQQEASYYPPHHQERLFDRVDPRDRQKLIRWCCQVMDYCQLDRSLVEVAINYTDRYVAALPHDNRAACCWTRTSYQLVAMTAVYTTVKIFGVEAMDPLLVSLKLARGVYTVQEIEQQERDLLRVLQWKMNPPTVAGFIGLYLDILVRRSMALPLSQQFAVYDCAMEHAMTSLEYTTTTTTTTTTSPSPTRSRRPSEVAFESLVTALRLETYASDEKIAWATSLLPVPYIYSVKLLPPMLSPRSVTFPAVLMAAEMLPLR